MAQGKNQVIRHQFVNPAVLEQKGISSVDIKRNSKGSVEFVVKVYNENPSEAAKKAISIFNSLDKKFPEGK